MPFTALAVIAMDPERRYATPLAPIRRLATWWTTYSNKRPIGPIEKESKPKQADRAQNK
jgi:hypothetical protein